VTLVCYDYREEGISLRHWLQAGTQATGIQFNGETVDDPTIAGMTVTDMGSGEFPDLKAKRRSAYMRYLQVQDTVDASSTQDNVGRAGRRRTSGDCVHPSEQPALCLWAHVAGVLG
jgi:hypothetical protein